MKVNNGILLLIVLLIMVSSSCSVSKQINKQATEILLKDSVISTGHVGISIYEPATDQYWYNYNATKYFVPASNTKLFSLYAGMKYLGDSLVGARYSEVGNYLFVTPTGDPTFLHPDFDKNPLLDLMKAKGDTIFVWLRNDVKPYGEGWSWDDYDQGYMVERSRFPVYGNQLWLSSGPILPKILLNDTLMDTVKYINTQWLYIKPKYFADKIFYDRKPSYLRNKNENKFFTDSLSNVNTIPFITNSGATQLEILSDLINKKFRVGANTIANYEVLKSQPTDSLLTPMMHRSDNFFAEQTLLMASNERLGYMNDEAIIDTLLNTDLKDIPQRPQWVDGSGLSRYNLFTPLDFIYILNRMKNEFGLARMKVILPTGGEGTIKNYYKTDSGFIYVKTGTLSNQVALSGYLITKENKLLIFSLLANNVNGSAANVRRAFEKFLKTLRKKY